MIRSETPSPAAAISLVVVAGVFLILGGLPLRIFFGEAGIIAAQVAFLLLPSLLFVRYGEFNPRTVFSVRWPVRREVVGGVVFLLGGLQIAWFLAWIQGLFVQVPIEYLEAMSDTLRANSIGRFFWLLLLAAIVPAVAEETLFRGVLLSGLRSRLSATGAVVLSGVIFGLFHLTPETAFRFLPTAWLGILLGWVVVASGSLPLAIFLHFCNNALILILSVLPMAGESVSDPEVRPPLLLLPVAILLFWWGGRRLLESKRGAVSAPSFDDSRLQERE